MKVFKGIRHSVGDTRVTVNEEILSPFNEEQDHSTDFEWGYTGSGPYQLAYAIVRETSGKEDIAKRVYKLFFDEVVSGLKKNKWKILESEVVQWLMGHTYQFWKDDTCLFDIELDKWLRQEDRQYSGYDIVEQLYNDFMDFTRSKTIYGDDPVEHLRYWFEHANAFRPSLGYSSNIWKDAPKEVLECGYDFFKEYINPNLVKRVKAELRLTTDDLAERTGYGKDAINKAASLGTISSPMEACLNLLLENHMLRKENERAKQLKYTLKEFLE